MMMVRDLKSLACFLPEERWVLVVTTGYIHTACLHKGYFMKIIRLPNRSRLG